MIMEEADIPRCVDCGATEDLIYTPGGVWVCKDDWMAENYEPDDYDEVTK